MDAPDMNSLPYIYKNINSYRYSLSRLNTLIGADLSVLTYLIQNVMRKA